MSKFFALYMAPAAAAPRFEGHPHLQIPRAWVEVLSVTPIPDM